MASEKAPLLPQSSGGFREVSQSDSAGLCGCRCNPLPAMCRRKKTKEEDQLFSSSLGVFFSMMGSVVGTGNIWRFPRIVANNATEGGALVFLIVWAVFLWMWSIPIILIEYGVGRYTRKSVVESFNSLIGPAYRFLGGFSTLVNFCIASYYSVLLGWCGYYFIQMVVNPLPDSLDGSNVIWNGMKESNWPVLCHAVAIIIGCLSVSRGVSTIEPVNNVVVPLLLILVVFSFYWALFLPYAEYGIKHMFSPSWSSFKDAGLWLDAISQNAWDTGAGGGLFLTYASYMKRSQGAVKLGIITPFFNNIVSLLCGVLLFCTVFSVQLQANKGISQVVDTLQENGPANSGLTFIWMPLLYSSITGGRFLAAMFFLCLSLAGLSSLIALMELPVHILTDFGICRLPATVLVGITMFLVGVASALDMTVLVNQDSVWGYALILNGCILIFLVLRYGILAFRRNLYNKYGIGDWPLPWVWVIVVAFIAPVEGVGLIIWWIVDQIVDNPGTWWQFSNDSLATVLAEWAVLMLLVIGLNWCLAPLRISPPANRRLRKFLGFFVKFHEVPAPVLTTSEPPERESLNLGDLKKGKYYMSGSEEESIIVKDVDV